MRWLGELTESSQCRRRHRWRPCDGQQAGAPTTLLPAHPHPPSPAAPCPIAPCGSPHVLPLVPHVVVVLDANGALGAARLLNLGLRHAQRHLAVELGGQGAAWEEGWQGAAACCLCCRGFGKTRRTQRSAVRHPPRRPQRLDPRPPRPPPPRSHKLPVSSMWSRTRSCSASRLPPGFRPRARHWMRRSLSRSGCAGHGGGAAAVQGKAVAAARPGTATAGRAAGEAAGARGLADRGSPCAPTTARQRLEGGRRRPASHLEQLAGLIGGHHGF